MLCSCSGNIYKHNTPYTVKKGAYLQSLVPVLCACPTTKQTAKEITSLLVYTVNYGETVKSIGEAYGVDEESILEANELQVAQSENSSVILYALTPILFSSLERKELQRGS
ncbi:hypothetical protein TSUD_257980 [Trifolium subterraneum]|uniref:LYK4/5 third LysM domain-containing protein n=1 Tax=Trifolium subterraneum TaxID=3900 RepID=A0A2Z6LYL3_TRISU|nr:hypothetical protein TSUD_257980 [Trifolium subterraneum]